MRLCVCVPLKIVAGGHILAANELLDRAALEAAATLLILLLRLVLCFPKLIVICAICLHTHTFRSTNFTAIQFAFLQLIKL